MKLTFLEMQSDDKLLLFYYIISDNKSSIILSFENQQTLSNKCIESNRENF